MLIYRVLWPSERQPFPEEGEEETELILEHGLNTIDKWSNLEIYIQLVIKSDAYLETRQCGAKYR